MFALRTPLRNDINAPHLKQKWGVLYLKEKQWKI